MDRQLKNRFDRHTMTGIALCEEHAALQQERDLILIMEGVDEGKACSGNALNDAGPCLPKGRGPCHKPERREP